MNMLEATLPLSGDLDRTSFVVRKGHRGAPDAERQFCSQVICCSTCDSEA